MEVVTGGFEIVNGTLGVASSSNLMILVPDNTHTAVRVAAGLGIDPKDSTGGNVPGVHLYDGIGRSIGYTYGTKDKIDDGGYVDILVPTDNFYSSLVKTVEYISVVNGGHDALCIASIAVAQPTREALVWNGALGALCGADWYHSRPIMSGSRSQPICIWIDRDRSNGIRFQGFGMHILDFAATDERAKDFNKNTDWMCKSSPRFRMYENMISADPIPTFKPPLEYDFEREMADQDPAAVLDESRWSLPYEGPNIKRKTINSPFNPNPGKMTRRQEAQRDGKPSVFDNLIVSPEHSAVELCDSPTSKGPDFVSLEEELFCNMDIKELWPLCGASKTDGCFDLENTTIRTGNGTGGAIVESVNKEYGQTIYWT